MNRTLIGLCSLSLVFAASCGGGGSEAPPKPKPSGGNSAPAETAKNDSKPADAGKSEQKAAPKGGKQDWADSMGTTTVSGKVAFNGQAPTPKSFKMDSDPVCNAMGEGTEETVIVNSGGLANVVVSVSKGLDGYKFAKGSGKVTIDQKGCKYIPHVVAMQAGQTLSISNSDDTVHNVHSYSKRNQAFNQAQPAGAGAIEKEMKRKDKMFSIKCDMHSWMGCQVAVFDHPFFTVSDDQGNFSLPMLPAGTYTLTAEHETLGKQETEITVPATGTANAEFTFGM